MVEISCVPRDESVPGASRQVRRRPMLRKGREARHGRPGVGAAQTRRSGRWNKSRIVFTGRVRKLVLAALAVILGTAAVLTVQAGLDGATQRPAPAEPGPASL